MDAAPPDRENKPLFPLLTPSSRGRSHSGVSASASCSVPKAPPNSPSAHIGVNGVNGVPGTALFRCQRVKSMPRLNDREEDEEDNGELLFPHPRYGLRPRPLGCETSLGEDEVKVASPVDPGTPMTPPKDDEDEESTKPHSGGESQEEEMEDEKETTMDTPELIRCKLGLQPFDVHAAASAMKKLNLDIAKQSGANHAPLDSPKTARFNNNPWREDFATLVPDKAGENALGDLFGPDTKAAAARHMANVAAAAAGEQRFAGYREDNYNPTGPCPTPTAATTAHITPASNTGGNVFSYPSVVSSTPTMLQSATPAPAPVELQVTNLDQSITQRDMKKVIADLFRPYVTVLNMSVFYQSDGNMACCVKVGSLAEAQYAISKLHRTKVGYKRILISYNQPNTGAHPSILRSQVASLLADVPSGKLQLFNFREMFEKRYHSSIGVSDLYKMREVVAITEEETGRMVTLLPQHHPNGNKGGTNNSLSQHGVGNNGYRSTANVGGVNIHHGYNSYSGDPLSVPRRGALSMDQQHSMMLGDRGRDMMVGGAASSSSGGVAGVAEGNAEEARRMVEAQQALQLESPYCPRHASDRDAEGWAIRDHGTQLPLVYVGLQEFGDRIKKLIKSHHGSVPLSTLSSCYAAEFEALTEDAEDGVPLEHLVTCVKGVAIQPGVTGVKAVVLHDEEPFPPQHSHFPPAPPSTPTPYMMSTPSPYGPSVPASFLIPGPQPGMHQPLSPLAKQLAFFSRELVDLLKTQPGCVMLFNKFIPGYHHHFGRQCRAADYGYTKLRDLFKALPHVIQMMGEGSRSKITLAHRAQIKRFTSDLLKVLKSQTSKQIVIGDLSPIYDKVHGRMFKISDYGVCEIEDMLGEISDTAVVVNGSGEELTIAIPKREQTLDEVVRTQTFGDECLELLKHAPNCRLPFNKFIPSYHHHFGRQCRVADYGFTKLIELFEAIPTMVEITEDVFGERIIQLTEAEMLVVAGDQIALVIKACALSQDQSFNPSESSSSPPNAQGYHPSPASQCSVPVSKLEELYKAQFGYELVPEKFGKNDLLDLLRCLHSTLRLEGSGSSSSVRLIDRSYIKMLGEQVRELLLDQGKDGAMEAEAFTKAFKARYAAPVDLDQFLRDLPDLIETSDSSNRDDDLEPKQSTGLLKKKSTSSSTSSLASSGGRKPSTNADGEAVVVIRLVALQLCAARIEQLIKDYDGKLRCSDLEAVFVDKYNTSLCPGQFGFPSVNMLIQAGLNKHFAIRGRGNRKYIGLAKDLGDKFVPNEYTASGGGRSGRGARIGGFGVSTASLMGGGGGVCAPDGMHASRPYGRMGGYQSSRSCSPSSTTSSACFGGASESSYNYNHQASAPQHQYQAHPMQQQYNRGGGYQSNYHHQQQQYSRESNGRSYGGSGRILHPTPSMIRNTGRGYGYGGMNSGSSNYNNWGSNGGNHVSGDQQGYMQAGFGKTRSSYTPYRDYYSQSGSSNYHGGNSGYYRGGGSYGMQYQQSGNQGGSAQQQQQQGSFMGSGQQHLDCRSTPYPSHHSGNSDPPKQLPSYGGRQPSGSSTSQVSYLQELAQYGFYPQDQYGGNGGNNGGGQNSSGGALIPPGGHAGTGNTTSLSLSPAVGSPIGPGLFSPMHVSPITAVSPGVQPIQQQGGGFHDKGLLSPTRGATAAGAGGFFAPNGPDGGLGGGGGWPN